MDIDTEKLKITDDGKLTTLSKAIVAGDGITIKDVVDAETQKTQQQISANVDGTSIYINENKQIA